MTLYGIGIGPGDPELITLKALKVLKRIKSVFATASTKSEHSIALSVIKDYLSDGARVYTLRLSMGSKATRETYEREALRILEVLKREGEVAFVTMGDPLLYSTFGYLARELVRLDPRVKVEVIPGITAAQAAAARFKLTLAEGNEGFAITTALTPQNTLRDLLRAGLSLAVYKVYRNPKEVLSLIENENRLRETRAVSWCGFPQEEVWYDLKDLKERSLPYFTLLLVGGKRIEP